MNIDMHWSLILLTGAVVGVVVGTIGTSGAVIIPMLIYIFGLTQVRAQGTALLMSAIPVWFGPMIIYARAHQVEWKLGILLALGMGVGAVFGAKLALQLPTLVLRRGFAVMLAALAMRMFLQR
jgi:uncharacterized membrane protein YfcA